MGWIIAVAVVVVVIVVLRRQKTDDRRFGAFSSAAQVIKSARVKEWIDEGIPEERAKHVGALAWFELVSRFERNGGTTITPDMLNEIFDDYRERIYRFDLPVRRSDDLQKPPF